MSAVTSAAKFQAFRASLKGKADKIVRDEALKPSGVAGRLKPLENVFFRYKQIAGIDLADCLVERLSPMRIRIWEPLLTKAPSPPKAAPYCCYIQTVIFYHFPYVLQLRKSYWRDDSGCLREGKRGFEEWDQIKTRLACDDVVEFEGERYVVNGGQVLWKRSRWWMLRGARREERQR